MKKNSFVPIKPKTDSSGFYSYTVRIRPKSTKEYTSLCIIIDSPNKLTSAELLEHIKYLVSLKKLDVDYIHTFEEFVELPF